MDRERGSISPPRLDCGALLLALLLLSAGPAHARTTIVPDDFPTIQAAVDNVVEEPVMAETLLVRGGSYPEWVRIRYRRMVIQAIPPLDGSDRMPEIAGLSVTGRGDGYAFIGLHFTWYVNVISFGPDHFLFAGCRFDRGLSAGGRAPDTLRLTRCLLFQSVIMSGLVATVDSCTVYGPVGINAPDGTFVLDNRFENVPVWALRVGGGRTLVARNRVRGGAAFQAHLEEGDVRFEGNDIEGCQGWGIDIESRGNGHSYLERNQIAHCGGFGIKVHGSGTVRGNFVLDCRGPGIDVDQGEGAGVVEDNVVGRCDLAGIRLTNPYGGLWLPGLAPATMSVRGNTVYACSGPGITISYLPGSTIANNLVYACEALSASDSDPLLISHNNWFPASGEPSSPTDVSVDPQFCDLSADDVRLRSDSPLLDVPGVGRIGALGQGCEAPVVAMGFELWPHVVQPAARARWMTAWLEPPAPFTVQEIDVASVRVNDVPVADGMEASVGDRDRDGIPDLELKFDRAAIERTLTAGDEVTVTVTGKVGGRNFSGTDVIRVMRYPGGPRSEIPRNAPRDRVLSIHAPTSHGVTDGFRVDVTLVDESAARLEVLDVTGRVVLSREIGSHGAGEHTFDLAAGERLAQGIYFLRLRQGMSEARTRVVVVR